MGAAGEWRILTGATPCRVTEWGPRNKHQGASAARLGLRAHGILDRMSSSTRTIVLSKPLQERLSAPTAGAGGYQTLVQEIQKRLERERLDVDDALVERIEHYAFDYGAGGWQQLLRDLLAEIESSASHP
jgi:hypothetical protein